MSRRFLCVQNLTLARYYLSNYTKETSLFLFCASVRATPLQIIPSAAALLTKTKCKARRMEEVQGQTPGTERGDICD